MTTATDRVVQARREAGLTQKALAERLGVSLWTVERVENGTANPTDHLASVSEATGKPLDWFVADPQDLTVRRTEASVRTTAVRIEGGLVLVLGALVLLVVIRFFTEVVVVLPRAANFVDVPILVVLLVAALLSRAPTEDRSEALRYAVPALLFLVLCVLSAVANPSRVEYGPVLVFIYGFLGPLGVYYATYRLWLAGRGLDLSRVLIVLGLVQIAVVALVDLPKFIGSQNPDDIGGTFGTNPYQLVFFLLIFIALLAGIFNFEQKRPIARFVPALMVAVVAIILIAQYRALLVTTVLTLAGLASVLGPSRLRGVFLGGVLAAAFVVTLNYTSQAFPVLRLAPTVDALRQNPKPFIDARLAAIANVGELYADHPRYIATGTGPGTFSSRAWQTFAFSESKSKSNVQGAYAKLVVGGGAYRTDVSDRYVLPHARRGTVYLGSRAATSPYSSWGSLLAEVGLLGLILIGSMYLLTLVRAGRMVLIARRGAQPGDPLPALLLAATAGLFILVQMAVLENWLEVTRVTFPTWILLAVATKEFTARYGTREM
jgi:DNA-binding XRE family transcriptional regulator